MTRYVRDFIRLISIIQISNILSFFIQKGISDVNNINVRVFVIAIIIVQNSNIFSFRQIRYLLCDYHQR